MKNEVTERYDHSKMCLLWDLSYTGRILEMCQEQKISQSLPFNLGRTDISTDPGFQENKCLSKQ